MKRFFLLTALCLSLAACSQKKDAPGTNVSVEQAKELIAADSELIILDVRTPEEVAQVKIDGSIHLNLFDKNFGTELDKLDKSKTYLVYCKMGGRSTKAVAQMKLKGFENLHNLTGGITAWNTQN